MDVYQHSFAEWNTLRNFLAAVALAIGVFYFVTKLLMVQLSLFWCVSVGKPVSCHTPKGLLSIVANIASISIDDMERLCYHKKKP